MACAAADPQHRALGRGQACGQCVERGFEGTGSSMGSGDRSAGIVVSADWMSIGISTLTGPVGAVMRELHRALERAQHRLDAAHAQGRLGHGLEHGELVGRLVDVRHALVEVGRLDLARDVQQRRAGRQRFDHAAGDVARGRAGAGEAHAQAGGGARIGVGHVAGPGFAACGHEADRRRAARRRRGSACCGSRSRRRRPSRRTARERRRRRRRR
jgi:hypothetical protein